MGRPIKHLNKEDRNNALKESKTKYMLNKEWRCPACDNHNYSLAGKWSHMRTRKHTYNTIKKALQDDDDIELITDE